jgi:hypothetical protein
MRSLRAVLRRRKRRLGDFTRGNGLDIDLNLILRLVSIPSSHRIPEFIYLEGGRSGRITTSYF